MVVIITYSDNDDDDDDAFLDRIAGETSYVRPIATGVARSVVCASQCVWYTGELCIQTGELIEMPFGGQVMWIQGTR